MIKINLLPKNKKEEIKWRRISQLVIFYGAIALIILGIFIGFLFAVKIFLKSEITSLDQKIQLKQKSAKMQELKTLEGKVKAFNKEASALNKIQIEHAYFSQIIEECVEIIPKGIQISVFDMQKLNESSVNGKIEDKNSDTEKNLYKIIITGKAETREDIVALKDALEKSKNFQDPYLPLANLTERYDVEFTITALLKEEALRKY